MPKTPKLTATTPYGVFSRNTHHHYTHVLVGVHADGTGSALAWAHSLIAARKAMPGWERTLATARRHQRNAEPSRFTEIAERVTICEVDTVLGYRLSVEEILKAAQNYDERPGEALRDAQECGMCGEPFSAHRAASGNSAPFCTSLNSRPGDTFVRSTSAKEVK